MIKRSGRELDLSGFGQSPVLPQNSPQNLLVNFKNTVFFLLGKSSSFLHQGLQFWETLPNGKSAPGKIEPHLQIPQIAFLKPLHILHRLRGSKPSAAKIQELSVTRIWIDTGGPVDLEEVFQNLLPLLCRKLVRLLPRQLAPTVLYLSLGQLLNLPDQDRSQIEIDFHLWMASGHLCHVGVPPDRVQPHPRHQHFPGLGIEIGGLVQMPKEGDVSHESWPPEGHSPLPLAASD